MAQITIDLSGRKGLAPKWWGDAYLGATAKPELRYLGKEGQHASGISNPFKRYGYLSAADNTFTDVTFDGGSNPAPGTRIGSTIYDVVNNDGYVAEIGEEIYRLDGLADVTATTVLDLGSTGTPVIMDLEIYEMSGSRKIYYAYETGGNMEIGNANLPFASANNNWLSTDTSGNFTNALTNTVFMRVADNGFMYIFQDNHVHKVDGTAAGGANGTVTPDVLLFPANFQITDAVDYRGNLYIVIRQDTVDQFGKEVNVQSQHNKIGVYVWDRSSTVVNTRDFFPISGIKEVRKIYVGPKGDLRVITNNSQRIAEVRAFNGATFEVIKTIGYKASPAYHDSLEVSHLATFWYGIDGNIYAHGQITEDDSEELFWLGQPALINNAGAILFGGDLYTSEGFYISWRNTAGPADKLSKWKMFGTGTPHKGDVYTLVKFLPQMSTVNFIEIYCRPIGSGSTTAATVKVYFNQSTSAFKSHIVTEDDMSRGYVRIECNKQYVNAVQFEIEFTTVTSLSSDVDFAPSLAVIDFDPTDGKG